MDTRLIILVAVALALAGLIVLIVEVRRSNPAERERLRRLEVNRRGRMGDGTITDIDGDLLHYTYRIHGVSYNASQDVSSLRQFLPDVPDRLAGPAHIKYSPRIPANSILICESWSGLRNSLRPREAGAPNEGEIKEA